MAATKTVEAADGLTVAISDLGPRFLQFYAAAQGLDADARWALWKQDYDFAAVPPTPEGDKVARKLLDEAWSKYPAILPVIRAGAPAMQPHPIDVLKGVADLLVAPRPLRVNVIAYVGALETNAFTMGGEDGPTVAVPLEMAVEVRRLVFTHEMTHAVHMLVGKLTGGYERALGRVVFEEGLAMRVTQRLHPGLPDSAYVEHRPGWFEPAMAKQRAILEGILPMLDRSGGEDLFRFTMGTGVTGTEREAYVAGWIVVGHLLRAGQTFPQLARIPETELPGLVRTTIKAALAET